MRLIINNKDTSVEADAQEHFEKLFMSYYCQDVSKIYDGQVEVALIALTSMVGVLLEVLVNKGWVTEPAELRSFNGSVAAYNIDTTSLHSKFELLVWENSKILTFFESVSYKIFYLLTTFSTIRNALVIKNVSGLYDLSIDFKSFDLSGKEDYATLIANFNALAKQFGTVVNVLLTNGLLTLGELNSIHRHYTYTVKT